MRCLDTPDEVMVDGANAVCGAPRAHFPDSAPALALGAVALLAFLLLLRARRSTAVGAVLVAAALPGLGALAWLRADAPLQRGATTAAFTSSLDSLKAAAPWPGEVRVATESDDVWFPLGRYALPTRPHVGSPRVEVHLGQGPLGARCTPGPTVRCGVAP